MSACSTFTEHVWKPGECKNCFKPKSLHCLTGSATTRPVPEPRSTHLQGLPAGGTRANTGLPHNTQRASSGSARTGHFRPPVAKKPTIAVKPTMMLPSSPTSPNSPSCPLSPLSPSSPLSGLDSDGNAIQSPTNTQIELGKPSAFTVWNHNGLNQKRPCNNNNNEMEGGRQEIESYGPLSPRTPSGNNNSSGLTDVLKEIAGLGPGPSSPPLSGSKDLFWGRISTSYRKSLERGLPAASCLAMGSSISGGDGSGGPSSSQKRVSLSDSAEIISREGGRFCYPEFSSEDEDDDDDEDDDTERDDEHESWDESDEELLAMEIRMRGQPRFANFRAATLSPVPFAAGKKWNTVPLRNRSLQRICAVDYDDSYDEILNGYPSIGSNGSLMPYAHHNLHGSGFLSNSESTTSPESSSSQPETTSSSDSNTQCFMKNGLQSPTSPVVQCTSPKSPVKVTEMHTSVLAIRLEDKDCKEPMPQAIQGQPVTISFSPTEEKAKPYRVVNLEKSLICKPYTVVDVSASMASKDENISNSSPKSPKISSPTIPTPLPKAFSSQPLSPTSPSFAISPKSPISVAPIPATQVWTSSTSPRQKIAKVDFNSGASVTAQYYNHKSAPTSPIAGLSSSRTVPVKSPNLSEIKFNSFNNAGMPPFPIIIRDEPAYARSCKNAVKVPIVINPSAYDNLAVYKSFLGVCGELPPPKGAGSRVASHTYEEIGSSESVQSSSTDKTISGKGTSERASFEDKKMQPELAAVSNSQVRSNVDSGTVSSTSSKSGGFQTISLTSSPANSTFAKNSPTTSTTSRDCRKDDNDFSATYQSTGSHREEASAVLSQIVTSIQPPQTPPDSPTSQDKTLKETIPRPKSLFTAADVGFKSKKDTPSKILAKSQSASAAVSLSSPKSEQSAPFPPPRSTSSPYHATNILQRHFANWTKSSGFSSPLKQTDGDGRSGNSESSKPKRWISFRSFFKRRKDDDEQKEKVEKVEKEKGKLVGLDGTVIHMLPAPPVQQHQWFAEAKPEDPNQKPTIIFTYKPDCGPGEGELRIEEVRETTLLNPEESLKSGSSRRTPSPSTTGGEPVSQVPVSVGRSRDVDYRGITPLPSKVDLGLVLGEDLVNQALICAAAGGAGAGSEGSASLWEPEEEPSNHSHSPASSQCSATYSNLGQSRANMIPTKQPRNMKSSNDTLASLDLDDPPFPKATPPPLPKKNVPRSCTEPSLGHCKDTPKPRGEAKPGGTNLSVANPLYDLDNTWETASQSSSMSSEPHRLQDQESGDSLERPSNHKSRPVNSMSCLLAQNSAPRERKGYLSTECLAGRTKTSSKSRNVNNGGTSKQAHSQRPALYKGLDSWDEVVGRIRGLHCEDRFMAGQKDHVRFGMDSWSDFRLVTGKPCCEAGDAVYYTASYAKDPSVSYAIKICRSKVKGTQQQFFHSLAVRQSLPVHFNIQQDCGHFLADVPGRLLPWEEEEEEEEEEDELKDKESNESKPTESKDNGKAEEASSGSGLTCGSLKSRVVVITREVPFQTVADFVQDGVPRHTSNPELYERQVCLLLLQLCSGLEHMKPFHVTHCDLRLENLLLVLSPSAQEPSEPNNNTNASGSTASLSSSASSSTCPARLIISNFSQAKQKSSLMVDPGTLKDQSRLAPEIITATQYRKCDEFQTGILIYEMLHRPNPFEEHPQLKEREYTWADLPALPVRSLYSQGLQRLARLLLTVNPTERIRMSEARACLQCLLWGPREDLFTALGCSTTAGLSGASHCEATLQNWLDLKRTLMMIKFAERSMDSGCGVGLEDWLCCQYLAFASTESLSRVVHILQQPQGGAHNHTLSHSQGPTLVHSSSSPLPHLSSSQH
ncbi:hypothetical protein WMY93_022301 [Mugilogobius chulae]|uniref:Inactive tyrosine-protein kinase PEAK1 n=1 Tax=Mugilogobius chulae TaxID=88201 RepID=A0AAW0NIW8_9GOBI